MTIIIKVNAEVSFMVNFNICSNKCNVENYTIISTNASLIKYLLKSLQNNDLRVEKNGYACLRRDDEIGSRTSLQRIIVEFYAQYDEKLKNLLVQTDKDNKKVFDVDHINNVKLDNRTSNFQILSHKDNINKQKGNEYFTEVDTNYLQQLDNEIKKLEKYKKDEKRLKVKDYAFRKVLRTGVIDNINDCCYLDYTSCNYEIEFNNDEDYCMVMKSIVVDIAEKMQEKKKSLIIDLNTKRNKAILIRKLNHNLSILNYYRNRYKYLDELICKFNILDNFYNYKIDEKFNIYDMDYQLNLSKSKEILYDLYQQMVCDNDYSIKYDNVIKRVNIRFEVEKLGKYNSFRIMYILGLLKRENSRIKSSFISVPIYTDELLKQANQIAKKILKDKWRKVRFFMVMEELGEEMAKRVYKERFNELYNKYKKYYQKAKEDIIELLANDKELYSFGYITIEEIYTQIELLNLKRKENGVDYNPVYKNFDIFIKDLFLYNTDTKNRLEELGLCYTVLNKDIIKNIEKYQHKNGFLFNNDLKSKNRIIILKKLNTKK